MATATEHLSCAETAKLVRKTLGAAFPGVRFSVRSATYAGGASIDVRWADGPGRERVERVVKVLEGADFDGMTDLKTYHDTVLVGPEGPRLVHLGADFIFCHRAVTNERQLSEEAAAIIRGRCATEGTPPNDRFGKDWVVNLARAMACSLDFDQGDTLEDAFRQVVLGQE